MKWVTIEYRWNQFQNVLVKLALADDDFLSDMHEIETAHHDLVPERCLQNVLIDNEAEEEFLDDDEELNGQQFNNDRCRLGNGSWSDDDDQKSAPLN